MSAFEEVVEGNRKMFENGEEPAAHAILVKDDKPVAMIGLVFVDSFTKQLTFRFALPQIVQMHRPESCILVLPSRIKMLDVETGEIVREDDVVVVHEIDAIKIRTVVIVRKDSKVKAVEVDERSSKANLVEPIREAMRSVWADVI